MLNKKDFPEILKVGIILFVITAIAAGILAAVNGVTAPVIATNNERIKNEAMKKVLPDADGFEQVSFTPNSVVKEIYESNAGYVVTVTPSGYGGEINMVVGVNNGLSVTGIEIVTQSETAGLGSNCTRDEFKEQYIGKGEGIVVVKSGAMGNQVDAITSATITTKAVTLGVNEAVSAVKTIKEGN